MTNIVTITLEKYDELKGYEFKYQITFKENEENASRLKGAIEGIMSYLIDIRNTRLGQDDLDDYRCAFPTRHRDFLRSLGITDQEMIDYINLRWDEIEKVKEDE